MHTCMHIRICNININIHTYIHTYGIYTILQHKYSTCWTRNDYYAAQESKSSGVRTRANLPLVDDPVYERSVVSSREKQALVLRMPRQATHLPNNQQWIKLLSTGAMVRVDSTPPRLPRCGVLSRPPSRASLGCRISSRWRRWIPMPASSRSRSRRSSSPFVKKNKTKSICRLPLSIQPCKEP